MKRNRILLAVVISVFQISALSYLLLRTSLIKKEAEKNNSILVLDVVAYDPMNPFKGRYLELSLKDTTTEEAKKALSLKNPKIIKEYYMQENHAEYIDKKIRHQYFDMLCPQLELYITEKGDGAQKCLTVLDITPEELSQKDLQKSAERITVEEYCEKYNK